MSAVIESGQLQLAARTGAFDEGSTLFGSRAVRALAPEDGGARARVLDGDGIEYEPWVGIVDGVLSAECECQEEWSVADSPEEGLCAHAVATALAAIDRRFAWAPAASVEG